jgi:hypothetical protein
MSRQMRSEFETKWKNVRVSSNYTLNGYNKAVGAKRPGIFFPSITHFMYGKNW